MHPLFRGADCAVNDGGISMSRNPLSRVLDGITNDPLHAHQLREGFMCAPERFGAMASGSKMLAPMRGKPGGLEYAWRESDGFSARIEPQGLQMGDAMASQFAQHFGPGQQVRPGPAEAGFFMAGSMGPLPAGDWIQEFGTSSAPQRLAGHLPSMADRGEMQAAFAQMHAAPFHRAMQEQAHMECAFVRQQMFQQQAARQLPMMTMDPTLAHGQTQMGSATQQSAEEEVAQMEADAAFHEAQMEEAWAEAIAGTSLAPQIGLTEEPVALDVKVANVQIADFIERVNNGELHFKEDTVVDSDGKEVDWESLYDPRAATASSTEKQELERFWSDPSGSARLEHTGAAGGQSGPVGSEARAAVDPALSQLWGMQEELGPVVQTPDMLTNTFASSSGDDVQQTLNNGRYRGEYEFAEDNVYLDSRDPLAEARHLHRGCRDREALLALEAELQRNPESSEGWRMLGQIYAELDQDVEAIRCLQKGHEVDNYNLDSLLALGVSCTNESDQLPALRYLRMWVENHEVHAALVQGMEPPLHSEHEAWRRQVTLIFNQCAASSPLDVDVFVALGVVENINRNYDSAIEALSTACRLRPEDHTTWNKLGATLANSGRNERAVVAYHQALQLKPSYARSWSNLAVSHANLGQHADAARFYLSSLVLSPNASRTWSMVRSCVLNMGSPNLHEVMDAIANRDLARCTALVDGVVDPSSLPLPISELPLAADDILASMGL